AGLTVRLDVVAHEVAELAVRRQRGRGELAARVRQVFVLRRCEVPSDALDLLTRERESRVLDLLPLVVHAPAELVDAELRHEDLDARLELVVAPSVLVVDA